MWEQQNYLIYTELTYSLSNNFAFSCKQALYKKKRVWLEKNQNTIFLS